MLQRTPTWMFTRPAKDAVANFLRKILPEKLAYRITRFKNIKMQDFSFKLARGQSAEGEGRALQEDREVAGSGLRQGTPSPRLTDPVGTAPVSGAR